MKLSILEKIRTRESYLERISVMSRNTQNATKTAIKSFENFCQAQFKRDSESLFEEINSMKAEQKERAAFDILQDFINYLNKQNLSGWSIRLTVLRLRPYFAYRSMMKLHNEDIRSELKFPKNIQHKPEPLSTATIGKILEHSSPERKALYVFLISSGTRIGEAVQLRKRDFERVGARYRISVRAKYTKTKRARITFMSHESEKYLNPILGKKGQDMLVFGTNEDFIQASQNEETYFLRLRQRAGLDEKYESGTSKVTIHSFRSFFITKLEKINEGLGHALAGHDRYMQQYERFSEEELSEFYLKAEPELIISDEERRKMEIERLKAEKSELEKLSMEKDMLLENYKKLEARTSRLEKIANDDSGS